MASHSPRTQINQFFPSKKRKALSPGLKHGRTGKDAKLASDGSPSEKGTLDNYLVSSQDQSRGSLSRHDTVKRNLALDINEILKDENKDSQIPEGVGMIMKEASQGSSYAGNITVGKFCSASRHSEENTEIQQFANDFLSLYCSELKSTATSPSKPKLDDHKRLGSPLLVDNEDKTSKKKHCIVKEETSKGAFSVEKKAENKQSAFQAAVVGDLTLLQASLRKCNKVSKSPVQIAECCTPGSSIVKSRAQETPRSTRGSSIFSPGEAFWNEAIEIADGLLTEAHHPVALAIECAYIESCSDKSRQILGEASSRIQQMGNTYSLELLRAHTRDSIIESSTLPVRNLDPLFEDKNLNADSPYCSVDDRNVLKSGEQSECGSVNIKISKIGKSAAYSECQTKEETSEVHKAESIQAMMKRKEDFLCQHSDKSMYRSPINEIKNPVSDSGYREACTPSSIVPLQDQLDLDNWLPAEVCSIYRRKGISKLYSWQVISNFQNSNG